MSLEDLNKVSSSPKESKWNRRPSMLAYHHQVEEHFPERESFENTATPVLFGAPIESTLNTKEIWQFVPPSLEVYSKNAAVVISSVSSTPKFSKGYNACTGLVGLGIDKETQKPISFLSHMDPSCLLGTYYASDKDEPARTREIIREELEKRLIEMLERCEPKSLSFEIVGGGYTDTVDMVSRYEQSVVYLANVVHDITDIDAFVAFGPNNELQRSKDDIDASRRLLHNGPKNTDVYVDTPNGGVVIVRPEVRNPRWNVGFTAPLSLEEMSELRRSTYPLNPDDTSVS